MKKIIINYMFKKIRKYIVKKSKKTDTAIDDCLVYLFDEFVNEFWEKHQ